MFDVAYVLETAGIQAQKAATRGASPTVRMRDADDYIMGSYGGRLGVSGIGTLGCGTHAQRRHTQPLSCP